MAMLLKYKSANTEVKINRIGMQIGENKHERVHETGANSSECEQFTLDEILKII